MTSDRGGQAFRLGLFLLPSSALLSGICLFVACVSGSRGRDRPVWQARWTQPFLVAALLMLAAVLRPDGWWRRGAALVLTLSTVVAVVLTQSRNAMGAWALSVPFVMGPMQWVWLFPLLLLLASPLVLVVLPGVPSGWRQLAMALIHPNRFLIDSWNEEGPLPGNTPVWGSGGMPWSWLPPVLGWAGGLLLSVCCTRSMRPSVGMAIPTISPWSWRSATAFR